MTPDVFAIVAASADCRRLFGKPPRMRFYSFGEVPEGTPPPYATWQVPSGTPTNYLGQVPDTDEQRVQIDVWARTEAEAKEAAVAIRAAVQEHAQETSFAQRAREGSTRYYGFMLEFQFFSARS